MTTIHSLLVNVHIAIGALALPLFWVPALARKGSSLHVRAGKFYAIAMYAVSITAFLASIIVLSDPLGIRRPGEIFDPEDAAALADRFRLSSLFLLMLSVLVFTSVRHGIAALRARTEPGALSRPLHRSLIAALALLALLVGFLGLANGLLLLIIFGGIGVSAAWTMFRESRRRDPDRRELLVAHLGGLIGSGIGAYTAFFAFGGARLLGDILTGQWQVIPWVLPAIVGTFAINRLSRRFRDATRRAGVAPAARSAGQRQ